MEELEDSDDEKPKKDDDGEKPPETKGKDDKAKPSSDKKWTLLLNHLHF